MRRSTARTCAPVSIQTPLRTSLRAVAAKLRCEDSVANSRGCRVQATQNLPNRSLRRRGRRYSPYCRFMESFRFERLSATGSVDGMARGCVDADGLSKVFERGRSRFHTLVRAWRNLSTLSRLAHSLIRRARNINHQFTLRSLGANFVIRLGSRVAIEFFGHSCHCCGDSCVCVVCCLLCKVNDGKCCALESLPSPPHDPHAPCLRYS